MKQKEYIREFVWNFTREYSFKSCRVATSIIDKETRGGYVMHHLAASFLWHL